MEFLNSYLVDINDIYIRQVGKQGNKDDMDQFLAPAEMLPAGTSEGRLPFVPTIDEDKCVACNACVRLCPHGAITSEGEADSSGRYLIRGQLCTGCLLCMDVCESDAVEVKKWETQIQSEVLLETVSCQACGVPFHVLEKRMQESRECNICTRTGRFGSLFQVLD